MSIGEWQTLVMDRCHRGSGPYVREPAAVVVSPIAPFRLGPRLRFVVLSFHNYRLIAEAKDPRELIRRQKLNPGFRTEFRTPQIGLA